MSELEAVLLSSLQVSDEQEELFAVMSLEVEPLCRFLYSDSEKDFSLLDAAHPLRDLEGSHVKMLVRGIKKDDPLPATVAITLAVFLHGCNYVRPSSPKHPIVSEIGSSQHFKHALRVIEEHLVKAESLRGALSRGVYLLNVLPDIVGYNSLGRIAGRICAATALIRGGYAPLPLIYDPFMCRVAFAEVGGETAKYLCNDFIKCYHHAARSILGEELGVVTQIDHVLSRRALEIFGDKDKARRWLNRPLVKCQNIPPGAYARTGHAKEVLEYLIRIEQGYFG